VFDWCKDGNVKKVDVLLTRGESVNAKDDQVNTRITSVDFLQLIIIVNQSLFV